MQKKICMVILSNSANRICYLQQPSSLSTVAATIVAQQRDFSKRLQHFDSQHLTSQQLCCLQHLTSQQLCCLQHNRLCTLQ